MHEIAEQKRKVMIFSRYAEERRRDWTQEGFAQDNDTRPTQEAFCKNCNTPRLCWYQTAQLRSADEGQTVMLQCTICQAKWREDT